MRRGEVIPPLATVDMAHRLLPITFSQPPSHNPYSPPRRPDAMTPDPQSCKARPFTANIPSGGESTADATSAIESPDTY